MTTLAHLHIQAENGPLSNECVDRGIISFQSLIEWVTQLPYGRNSDRTDYSLVLQEEKGACSTKNALIKAVADENSWKQVQLFLGLFLMSEKTHTGIGRILIPYGIESVPEAHTYLRIDGEILDVTGLETGEESFEESLNAEIEIQPNQIGTFKVEWHKNHITNFQNSADGSAIDLWEVREACIAFLSGKNQR